jgi:hypothetical protein
MSRPKQVSLHRSVREEFPGMTHTVCRRRQAMKCLDNRITNLAGLRFRPPYVANIARPNACLHKVAACSYHIFCDY